MRRRGGRSIQRSILLYGLLACTLLWTGRASGQSEPPTRDEAPSQGGGAQEGGAGEAPPPPQQPLIHPDAVSSFLVRNYAIKPKKLWKGLLETLRTAGYPPEEVAEDRMSVKTSFVDFDAKDFPGPVGGRPPEFGPDYAILQLVDAGVGKVSLEGIVSREGRGSALSVRARILVHGLDRRRHLRVLTDRRSTGVIETEFLKRLESALGLRPLLETGTGP